MKTTEYSEIENKYRADHVDTKQFSEWVKSLKPFSRKYAQGFDVYYRSGQHVVRHRYGTNYNALTVKCRKSTKSTADRVEVDLFLDVAPESAGKFMEYTGYKPEFKIFKKALIFHVDDNGTEISLVIYDIHQAALESNGYDPEVNRRFIEIEVEKSSRVTPQKAMKVLSKWDKILRKVFKLDKPLNESLYEIYGDGKYRLVRDARN